MRTCLSSSSNCGDRGDRPARHRPHTGRLQQRANLLGLALGEQHLADRGAVCGRPRADPHAGEPDHRMRAFDALDVDDLAPVEHGEQHVLAHVGLERLHGRRRDLLEVQTRAHPLGEAEQVPAEPIAAGGLHRQQADVGERGDERVGARLGHRERAGDVGHAPLGLLGGEEVQDGPDLLDGVQHGFSFLVYAAASARRGSTPRAMALRTLVELALPVALALGTSAWVWTSMPSSRIRAGVPSRPTPEREVLADVDRAHSELLGQERAEVGVTQPGGLQGERHDDHVVGAGPVQPPDALLRASTRRAGPRRPTSARPAAGPSSRRSARDRASPRAGARCATARGVRGAHRRTSR